MLTILVYETPKSVNCFKRIYRRLFWSSVVVREREAEGVTLRYIFCNPYRRIQWRKVANICGDSDILLPDDITPPAYINKLPASEHISYSDTAGQAALSILSQAEPDPREYRLLFYDRYGRFTDLIKPLSILCNEIMVITDNDEAYETLEEELLAHTGKPILINSEMPDSRFEVIIAPGGFEYIVRTHPGTVIFTAGEHNLPINGTVYFEYIPAIPNSWQQFCPPCISWKRFSTAILEIGKNEGLFEYPVLGYRQRICIDTPERVIEHIRMACGKI